MTGTPHSTLSALRVAQVKGYSCVHQNNIATNPHATSIAKKSNTTIGLTIKLSKLKKTHCSWQLDIFWIWHVWNDSTRPLWWLILLTVAPPFFPVAFLMERLPPFNLKSPPICMAPAARNWFQWRHGIQLETCVLSFDLTRWRGNMQLPSCRHWEEVVPTCSNCLQEFPYSPPKWKTLLAMFCSKHLRKNIALEIPVKV